MWQTQPRMKKSMENNKSARNYNFRTESTIQPRMTNFKICWKTNKTEMGFWYDFLWISPNAGWSYQIQIWWNIPLFTKGHGVCFERLWKISPAPIYVENPLWKIGNAAQFANLHQKNWFFFSSQKIISLRGPKGPSEGPRGPTGARRRGAERPELLVYNNYLYHLCIPCGRNVYLPL